MTAAPRAVITDIGTGGFAAALPSLLDIYVSAMGYAVGTGLARRPLWLDHSRRAGFRCVIAVTTNDDAETIGTEKRGTARRGTEERGWDVPDGRRFANNLRGCDGHDAAPARSPADGPDPIVGFAYGYLGARGQWWHDEVARGLGTHESRWLADYFELTELHVRPTHQGGGVGEALLRALVEPLRASHVLLSTPEGEGRAWKLYQRLEFFGVLRHFFFVGDGRPFAVLGRALPLPPTSAHHRW